jgi:hypothetical protein
MTCIEVGLAQANLVGPRRPNPEAPMRIVVVFGLILLVTAFDGSAARAGSGCCAFGPTVIYDMPPVPYAVSPTGYVFNPWDAARPSYLLNQGPQLPSLGAAARVHPTYAEAGYAFPNEYPYIVSYGSGSRYGYRALRHAPAHR